MVAVGGGYPVPTSEASYNTNVAKIDRVYPLNGGSLQADATWTQTGSKINNSFAQGLPALASANGQLYIPGVGNDVVGIQTVLDSAALQQDASDNLLDLATSTRFDKPWDGVMLDFEGVPSAYKAKLSTFYTLLATDLHNAGLQLYVWTRARVADAGSDYDDAYSNDFAVIGSVADMISLAVYSYWQPAPRSIGPNWWARDSLDYVLGKGVSASKIRLCVALFSDYWLNAGGDEEITYSQVSSLVSCPCMIGSNDNGNIYEKYASGAAGYTWIHDAATFAYEKALVSEYGLAGMDLFIPGMEDSGIWSLL